MPSSTGDLLVPAPRAAALREESRNWRSIDLSPRQLCDLELLLNGAFAPLDGFMNRAARDSVLQQCRLADGTLWPVPITLDVDPTVQTTIHAGEHVALRDHEGVMLAALAVEEVWSDGPEENAADQQWHLAGTVEGLQLPVHYDFARLRMSPSAVRDQVAEAGWRAIAAWTPPVDAAPADLDRAVAAATALDAGLLVHMTTGGVRRDDAAYYAQVRAYESALRSHPAVPARLALLPLAEDDSGGRGVMLRALIARNFGCTHLLIDREAPEEARAHEWELGITFAPLPSAAGAAPSGRRAERTAHPATARRGVTVFFTGLSGSGKSTIANALLVKLLETDGPKVTLLDGDLVRKHLSSELGYSKEHRDLNVRRIGYVASEITKHGGIAICAPIAPYDTVRREVRQMIEPHGGFVLVHVSTPLEVCEARDRKGLYAKARAGTLQQFTGISDPYEVPADASLVIDTQTVSAEAAATTIVAYLQREGYFGAEQNGVRPRTSGV